MTRERAIEELKDIKSEYSNRELGELRLMRSEVQALDMAIQALEQQKVKEIQGIIEGGWTVTFKVPEKEPCDDAISRDAVLDALLDYWHDIQFVDGSGYDVYEDCKAVIDDLPPVTQKSGKWIDVGAFYKHECSVCGNSAFGNHRFDEKLTDYCPNCGAKMESER